MIYFATSAGFVFLLATVRLCAAVISDTGLVEILPDRTAVDLAVYSLVVAVAFPSLATAYASFVLYRKT
jgi:hypothetical protein